MNDWKDNKDILETIDDALMKEADVYRIRWLNLFKDILKSMENKNVNFRQ